jgi:hypothetical protein
MKIRNDFVTNSSSSSFIIACKDVPQDFLIKQVLRDFYVANAVERWHYTVDEAVRNYDPNEVLNNDEGNLGVFIKTKAEIDKYDDYKGWGYAQPLDEELEAEKKELYYEISNNCTVRFNWDIVDKIIKDKYHLSYQHGYCD